MVSRKRLIWMISLPSIGAVCFAIQAFLDYQRVHELDWVLIGGTLFFLFNAGFNAYLGLYHMSDGSEQKKPGG
ncbi:MAG: hypothetical protein AAGI24_13390 [Pseudomonadota bacterium]